MCDCMGVQMLVHECVSENEGTRVPVLGIN